MYEDELYELGMQEAYEDFINENIKMLGTNVKTKVKIAALTNKAKLQSNLLMNKFHKERHKRYMKGEYDSNVQKN